ncbi:hypothetical protein [Pseudomonas nitroreducens]|uniref:hypothetical protein n=1 Tax=Pseudomonas nitroreducens TaxID=46680 RepID=UPI00147AF5F2|nr:hypothetical protein [Pseudomonas nitroreducens]NNN26453.1 hypothetical protein [Pseudomonas nitroreducens]
MTINSFDLVRTIRSASFNDDVVSELLLELSRLAPDARLALRALGMVQQMQDDSKALEEVYTSIMEGGLALCPNSLGYRSAHCKI